MIRNSITETSENKGSEAPLRYVFIINPISGKKNKKRIEDSIKSTFTTAEAAIEYTQEKGHAGIIARSYVRMGTPYCIAVGGDGTVNEVASALIHSDSVLGIIPAGSGNGLANYLRIPHGTKKALKVIQQHSIRTIDAGMLNEQCFFSNCGIGFDARVGHTFAQRKKRGFSGYVRSVLHHLISYKPKKYRLKIDGQKHKTRAFMITIANSGQYGNNIYISPASKIDDGLLDVCIVKPFPKAVTLPLGIRFLGNKIDRSPYLEVIHGKAITLRGKKKKQYIHYDGEPILVKGKIKICIKPGALRVIAPGNLQNAKADLRLKIDDLRYKK
ncbi:MAG: diacylglycerol kinase family lipid kinase [Bacteroidales bacterium]|nr:diacylglycerol kinase family lipid kinase [Bacteroidales bacterium]